MAEIEECKGDDCSGCGVCITGKEFESIPTPHKPLYLLDGEDYDSWEGLGDISDD